MTIKMCVLKPYVAVRGTLTFLLAIVISTATLAQPSMRVFEKEGLYIDQLRNPSPCRYYPSESAYDGLQPFDVLHYTLELALPLSNDSLAGTSTITMRLKRAVDSVTLHALRLRLDTVRVDGVVRPISIDTTAETFAIDLGAVRSAGDTLRIEIRYRHLPTTRSRKGYYQFDQSIGLPARLGYTMSEPSDARLWMPCFDEPWEKATAEMHLTVPGGYYAASNGKLIGATQQSDGTTTWHWREDHRIATYLMCITASRFSVVSLPYVNPANDTIPIQYVVWSDDSAECATYLPTVHQMVRTYSLLFGEYPFDKYGMTAIVPFGYGGMEHQTLTTLNRYMKTRERVVDHELAHQWWGDLVTCGMWSDVWLNESFATYAEALWKEHLGGSTALQHYMKDTLEHFSFGSWLGAIYDPVGQGFNLFDDVVYGKGAWVLHTLRGVVGDTMFFRILTAYRTMYAGKSAVTADFMAVADSVTATDMSWFFTQWVFGHGWPKYASTFGWSQDTLAVTLFQQQSASWPTYKMPIRLRAFSSMEETTLVVWDSLRIQSYRIPLTFRPDSVIVDPDGWVLKQIVQPPSGVEEESWPAAFRLYQNYPNPFNPLTTIVYGVDRAAEVNLGVFDLLGREVATLVQASQPAGDYAVEFDGATLAAGVYVCRLQCAGRSVFRKMLLLK